MNTLISKEVGESVEYSSLLSSSDLETLTASDWKHIEEIKKLVGESYDNLTNPVPLFNQLSQKAVS